MEVNLDEIEFISETTLSIKGTRRRTTIPKRVVDYLKLQNGDKIRWVLFKDGRMCITTNRKKETEHN